METSLGRSIAWAADLIEPIAVCNTTPLARSTAKLIGASSRTVSLISIAFVSGAEEEECQTSPPYN
jgi:hypothetical protein